VRTRAILRGELSRGPQSALSSKAPSAK